MSAGWPGTCSELGPAVHGVVVGDNAVGSGWGEAGGQAGATLHAADNQRETHSCHQDSVFPATAPTLTKQVRRLLPLTMSNWAQPTWLVLVPPLRPVVVQAQASPAAGICAAVLSDASGADSIEASALGTAAVAAMDGSAAGAAGGGAATSAGAGC